MNLNKTDRILDELAAAAGGLAHDAPIDPELLLDAATLIRGLVIEVQNLEAIGANQRAEIQRLRSYEGSY